MIKLDEACHIALNFSDDLPEDATISSINDIDNAWVFFFDTGTEPRYGVMGVCVEKETGNANAFAPFYGENADILDNSRDVEIPMKYKVQ